jgi:hypothetical protein
VSTSGARCLTIARQRLRSIPSQWRWRAALGLIIAIHTLLGIYYSVVTPVWEGYDEPGHVAYVRYIMETRSLPPRSQSSVDFHSESWQFSQRPLYYLLASAWLAPWQLVPETTRTVNPFGPDGIGGRIFLPQEDDRFLWQGSILAVRILRLFSIAISILFVFIAYQIALLVFTGDKAKALAGAAIVGFSPQVLFMGAIVNNDILAATLGSAAIYFCLRMALHGFRWRDAGAAGIILWLDFATKNTAILVLPTLVFSLAVVISRRVDVIACSRRRILGASALITSVMITIVYSLGRSFPFGSWISNREGKNLEEVLKDSLVLPNLFNFASTIGNGLVTGFISIWAALGWGNIMLPDWIYHLLAIVTLAAVAGVLLSIRSRGLFPLFIVGIGFGAAVVFCIFTIQFYAVWGRYVLALFPAYAVLLVAGISAILRQRKVFMAIIIAGMLVLALYTGAGPLHSAYYPPSPVSLAQVAARATPVSFVFNDEIEMVGYRLGTERVAPGGKAAVTVYLRAIKPVGKSYAMSIQLLDPKLKVITSLNSYPSHGNLLTDQWRPGEIMEDTYRLPIGNDTVTPSIISIRLALFENIGDRTLNLPVTGEKGVPAGDGAVFGQMRVTRGPDVTGSVVEKGEGVFGGFAELLGHQINLTTSGSQLSFKVTLAWRALQATQQRYAVFVHLVDETGQLVAQDDSEPRSGAYQTRWWEPGDIIIDQHTLTPKAGVHLEKIRFLVGMYDLANKNRVAVLDPSGQPAPNSALVIGYPLGGEPVVVDGKDAIPYPCPIGQYYAEYFPNEQLSGTPVLKRCENAPINYSLGKSSPDPLVPVDFFSARWHGIFDFEAGRYTFPNVMDDGMRIWIDDVLVLDKWFGNSGVTYPLELDMTAGYHAVKVEYFEANGNATAVMTWNKKN